MVHGARGVAHGKVGLVRMDMIDAVAGMAAAEAAGRDASRTSYATELNRRAPGLAAVAHRLVETAAANGLRPDVDGATQTRMASALERLSIRLATQPMDPVDATRAAHLDFTLQEAAGLRLPEKGGIDPLMYLADGGSSRGSYNPASILRNAHGINAHAIFDRADMRDMEAIASGRFDDVAGRVTRFAITETLKLQPDQMAARIAPRIAAPDLSNYPSTGVGKGPVASLPVGFGTKGAER